MSFFLTVVITLIISFYAMFPSFKLGLFGDDWLVLWRTQDTLGSSGVISYIAYLLSRYGAFDLSAFLIYKVLGLQSIYYYIAAYILRIVAAISFYPLIFFLTKNRVSASLSVLFFSVTAIGIDATNWVFNMPVYIAVAFLNFFFLFYIKSVLEEKVKLLFLSILFFLIALILASVRMTGIIPLMILLEIFLLLKVPKLKKINLKIIFEENFKNLKIFLIRTSIFLGSFFLIVVIGQAVAVINGRTGWELAGSTTDIFGIWKSGINIGANSLNEGKADFLYHPLITIGNMLLPLNILTVNPLFFISLGILIIILGIIFLKANWHNRYISIGIFISLSWMVISFFFAWLQNPQIILPFNHRYLTVSAVGLTILLSVMTKIQNVSFRTISILLFVIIILININSSRKYLQNQVDNYHGAAISEKIWSQMPFIPEIGKSDDPILFYFTGENKQILYGTLTFGFPVHMALLYNLDDFSKMPNPVDSWEQVVSAVTDGNSLAPFGLPKKQIPIENIYAFNLEGKDKLINTTEQIRIKLKEMNLIND